jgi:voltage-gated potassium channel Kch
VVFGVAVTANVLDAGTADLWIVVVSLSMLMTPLLVFAEDRLSAKPEADVTYELPDSSEPRVIIAGFGRFGQIVARILSAKHIPFTALDASHEQVGFVKRYGNEIYSGDASRLDLLEAAGAQDAQLFVLAIDDVDQSLRTAEVVRQQFPHLDIYARAHNRKHSYQLMDLGVAIIRRETFYSALSLTEAVLHGFGFDQDHANRSVNAFKDHDLARFYDHCHLHNDEEKMVDLAVGAAKELEQMFKVDAEDLSDRLDDT